MSILGVESSLHVMAYTTSLVSLQLDHHQLIFLLRLADSLSELTGTFLLIFINSEIL